MLGTVILLSSHLDVTFIHAYSMCEYLLSHHSLSKEQDTVGVLAPNIFVASPLEPFSSVSTPCRENQQSFYMFMLPTQQDEHTL